MPFRSLPSTRLLPQALRAISSPLSKSSSPWRLCLIKEVRSSCYAFLCAWAFMTLCTGNFIFGGTSSVPLAIAQRTDALLKKMRSSEEVIDKLGDEAGELKKVLKTV